MMHGSILGWLGLRVSGHLVLSLHSHHWKNLVKSCNCYNHNDNTKNTWQQYYYYYFTRFVSCTARIWLSRSNCIAVNWSDAFEYDDSLVYKCANHAIITVINYVTSQLCYRLSINSLISANLVNKFLIFNSPINHTRSNILSTGKITYQHRVSGIFMNFLIAA